MESEHDVAALEVRLGVEIRGVGDHPPPAVGAVHVPNVVAYRTNHFGGALLKMYDRLVRLGFYILSNLVRLTLAGSHVPGLESSGSATNLNPYRSPRFLYAFTPPSSSAHTSLRVSGRSTAPNA
jgi:hypothetical protein